MSQTQPSAPAAPNYAQLLKQGILTNIQLLPKQEQAEIAARAKYSPQLIQQQQDLQNQFGPTMYGQQLAARSQLDPLGTATYNALQGNAANYLAQGALNPQQAAAYQQYGNLASQAAGQGGWTPEQAQAYKALGQSTTGQLLRGTQADPTSLKEMSQAIRSRQGPYASGNAPSMAEAVYVGQRAQQLQQQRQQASQNFLGLQNPAGQAAQGLLAFNQLQTPQSQAMQAGMGAMAARNPMTDILGIQGVQAPVANQYVNPNAGQQAAQFGLSNYQNTLAANQLSQSNPWLSAAGGAASGAAAGTQISPGYGTAIGAVAGGLAGYFSNSFIKRNLRKIREANGLGIYEFQYRHGKDRYIGVLAEEVQRLYPDAVTPVGDRLLVRYDKIGIPFQKKCVKCGEFKNIDLFYARSGGSSVDPHRSDCKKCNDAKKETWKKAYPDRHKAKVKLGWAKWRARQDPDKERERIRAGYKRRQPKKTIYVRERRRNVPTFRWAAILRSALSNMLKERAKGERVITLLGCSVEEFKTYIQQKFKPGMAWNNYGTWQIDHIRPCRSFDLTDPEQQRQCFHYTNMQPLWPSENGAKNVKWSPAEEEV